MNLPPSDEVRSAGEVDRQPDSTPDAVAPPTGHPRFPIFDGLRAVAVLCVLCVHVFFFSAAGSAPLPAILSHLNVGVTIFFVISGFLLYRPLIAHRGIGPARPGFARYARRRALRILPAYWLALTGLTLIPGVTGVSHGDWLTQYTLLYSLPLSDLAQGCTHDLRCGLAQTWSLAVEATFYVALPLLYVVSERLAGKAQRSRWAVTDLGGLLLLSVVSIALPFIVSGTTPASLVAGTLLGFFFWFALGMALAVGSVYHEDRDPPPWLGWVVRYPAAPLVLAVLIYVVLCAELPNTPFLFASDQRLWTHISFGVIACLLVVPAVFPKRASTTARGVLGNRVLMWIGQISYGIFLWHYAVVVALGSGGQGLGFWPLLATTIVLSIAIASASYYAIERPLLRLK